MTVEDFEQEMMKKSVEILQSNRGISGTEANVIESTVQLIGFVHGMSNMDTINGEER